jgi:hypothetical protein
MSRVAAEAFFVPDGDAFMATELTRGPWDPQAQHAGPPSALLGRALERCEPRDDAMIARITLEILRPVPITRLYTEARVVRPGRSVSLLEATLSDDNGPVMLGRAWRIRTEDIGASAGLEPPPPAMPDAPGGEEFFVGAQDVGYHTGMEWRFSRGAFLELGPSTVWMRVRQPMVAGEEISPLQRVLAAADSGNGVSAMLDFARYIFINTDLTVHLHRYPAGEWVRMDARTLAEPHGVGMAESALHDEHGALGRSVQSLLLSRRPDSQ